MPKIISAQEAKKLFLSDDFSPKGYFVVEMKNKPHAIVLELEEHMKRLKNRRKPLSNTTTAMPDINLSRKIKNKLKELIF